MCEIIIRKASSEDIDFIVNLEQTAMPHPWTRDDIASLVDSTNKLALIASIREDNKEYDCGYVGVSWVIDEAEIGNICVLDSYRRKGVAKALLNELKVQMANLDVEKIFLEVDEYNSGAIKLYSENGFIEYSRRKGYYHNNGKTTDALLFVCSIN